MLFREGQTTRSHSIPRSLIPTWSKSFSMGLTASKLAVTADTAVSNRMQISLCSL